MTTTAAVKNQSEVLAPWSTDADPAAAIARQFGISQADVKRALTGKKLDR